MNNIIEPPKTAERPVDAFSAEELGRAWLAVHEERLTALGQNAVAIAALAEERYLSPDDRSAKAAELVRAKRRIEDDLIALGQVLTRCRADNPAPKPEPHADGLGDS